MGIISAYLLACIDGSPGFFMDLQVAAYKIGMGVRLKNGHDPGLVFFRISVIGQWVSGGVYKGHLPFAHYSIGVMGQGLIFKLFNFHEGCFNSLPDSFLLCRFPCLYILPF